MKKAEPSEPKARIFYARTDEFCRKGEKYAFLEEKQHVGGVEWRELQPDAKHTWLTAGLHIEFENFLSVGTKEVKQLKDFEEAIFKSFSPGVMTGRDAVVYDFAEDNLRSKIEQFCDNYNAEVHRYWQKGKPIKLDDFVNNEKVKWSERLKSKLESGEVVELDTSEIAVCLYRPFTKKFIYYDSLTIDRPALFGNFFPDSIRKEENLALSVSGVGFRSPFSTLVVNAIADWHLCASTDSFQFFPFYTYDEDGTNRRENITDWALEKFRAQYADPSISKWDIFYYVYALLHHPVYRERYSANLKRELPRVPFAPDFRAFAEAGARLADLHVNYERQPEYPLEKIENPRAALSWRVERMKLSRDKSQIVYNDFLTLAGVPAEAFEYRFGNRSALEWVIDQYQVSTDRRSGIINDPNRADDPQYVVRLVGQVINVILETVRLVRALPDLGLAES